MGRNPARGEGDQAIDEESHEISRCENSEGRDPGGKVTMKYVVKMSQIIKQIKRK